MRSSGPLQSMSPRPGHRIVPVNLLGCQAVGGSSDEVRRRPTVHRECSHMRRRPYSCVRWVRTRGGPLRMGGRSPPPGNREAGWGGSRVRSDQGRPSIRPRPAGFLGPQGESRANRRHLVRGGASGAGTRRDTCRTPVTQWRDDLREREPGRRAGRGLPGPAPEPIPIAIGRVPISAASVSSSIGTKCARGGSTIAVARRFPVQRSASSAEVDDHDPRVS